MPWCGDIIGAAIVAVYEMTLVTGVMFTLGSTLVAQSIGQVKCFQMVLCQTVKAYIPTFRPKLVI